jgi:fumarylacetoacetate (FAA) hydrolase
MRLSTLRAGGRDGTLVVVRGDGGVFARATGIAPTLQTALDRWATAEPQLRALAARLEAGDLAGEPLDDHQLAAPLPRAYEWLDGSAFLSHVRLARQARGAELPPELLSDPLVYQGGSGVLLGPRDPLVFTDPALGLDFEAELGVILGDVPLGVSPAQAAEYIRLICLLNDVTLRSLIPRELSKGFGFVQSKPATAFAAFAVTPDELGSAWRDGRAHIRVRCTLNGDVVGDCDAGEMHFSFPDLIAHIARTRALTAGTIVGSGTVSNEDTTRGVSCLVERRMRETLASGTTQTSYLRASDHIRIEVQDAGGRSLFGAIDQQVSQQVTQEVNQQVSQPARPKATAS